MTQEETRTFQEVAFKEINDCFHFQPKGRHYRWSVIYTEDGCEWSHNSLTLTGAVLFALFNITKVKHIQKIL